MKFVRNEDIIIEHTINQSRKDECLNHKLKIKEDLHDEDVNGVCEHYNQECYSNDTLRNESKRTTKTKMKMKTENSTKMRGSFGTGVSITAVEAMNSIWRYTIVNCSR